MRLALTIIACALTAVAGCRQYRTLEEIEESLGQLEQVPAAADAADPLLAGFQRVRRMFADGEAIFADHQLSLARGERRDRAIELDADACYTFIGFGVPSTFDVDLRLDGPNGLPVAEDRSPDPFPVIPFYCPVGAGTFNLRVEAARGAGEVRVGGYRMLDPVESDAARRIDVLRSRYLGDARPLGPVIRRLLGEGDEHEFPVALLAGRCYAVVAVSSEGMTDLDLELRDEHEEILVRDIGTDAVPVIERHCPETSAGFRLRFRAYAGSGDIFWQLFERS